MTTLSRTEIRQAIRQQRQQFEPANQQLASAKLLAQLSNLNEVHSATNIAIYLANDGELDPMPFIQWCWQHGKNIYLPVLHPFTKGHLLFLKYEKDTEMVLNKYGILEPILSVLSLIPVEKLDIIFTPLVAFDKTGNRLGMGGGFYDRTLSRWYESVNKENAPTGNNAEQSLKNNTLPIGLAHHFQLVDELPCEYWDIPLPLIITPEHSYSFT